MKVPHKIETQRLVLRPYQKKDIEPFLEFMLDIKATRYLDFTDEQRTEKGARELFDFVIKSYTTNEPVFAIVIALKKNNEFVGSCGLSPLADKNTVECYYSLFPRYWKKGFATEAMRALLKYAFEQLMVTEVVAFASPYNTPSWRVAERIGMTFRGVVENVHTGLKGKKFSITKLEFEAVTC